MLSGRLDAQSSSELSGVLADTIAERPPRLALDLAGVEYLSSMALRVLLELKKAVGSWRGELRLVAPRPVALEVLTLAGFTRLFEICDRLAEE